MSVDVKTDNFHTNHNNPEKLTNVLALSIILFFCLFIGFYSFIDWILKCHFLVHNYCTVVIHTALAVCGTTAELIEKSIMFEFFTNMC